MPRSSGSWTAPSTLSLGANGGAAVILASSFACASVEPASEVLGDERIVGEVGVLATDAVDRLALPRAQSLGGVEAPRALEQPLTTQHFVASGDAAAEVVGDVEERAVAIGDPGIERAEQTRRRAAFSKAPMRRHYEGDYTPDQSHDGAAQATSENQLHHDAATLAKKYGLGIKPLGEPVVEKLPALCSIGSELIRPDHAA